MRPALLGWLERPPARTALVDVAAGRTLTYADLASAVLRRAKDLASPSKSLVACLCRADTATITGYLAALAAGHAVMLIDAAADPRMTGPILDAYQAEFVLDADTSQRLRRAGGPVHDDLAVLLSTSGSTGTPKYVRLSRLNLDSNAAQIAEALGIDATERAVQALPLHYSYGLSVLNSHLLAGACVVLPGTSLIRPGFWDVMKDHQCTSMAGVPYTYTILGRIGFTGLSLPDLRTLTQAGGRMEPATVLRFARHMAARGGQLIVMYGQTEATARIACLPPGRVLDKPDRVGRPVPGGKLSLAADGELIYEGPNVMLGYAHGRSDLALGDVHHGRLATGDLAQADDEGLYAITGRKRRIAKLSGQRVNLDELETLLAPDGRVAALEAAGELVLARATGEATVAAGDLSRQASELIHLPARLIRVLEVERVPRTSSGKTDYATLASELGISGD